MTQVRDIMQKNVITIEQDKTSLDVATILKEKEISFLVIMENEKPIGIVTERDIVKKIAAEDKVASKTPLKEIMSKKFLVDQQGNKRILYAQVPIGFLEHELITTGNVHTIEQPIVLKKVAYQDVFIRDRSLGPLFLRVCVCVCACEY